MTDRIEPALSAEEWARWTTIPHWMEDQVAEACAAINDTEQGTPAKLIALANAALPDSDPRKITRADIAAIDEGIAGIWGNHSSMCVGDGEACGCNADSRALTALKAKLESHLPPE